MRQRLVQFGCALILIAAVQFTIGNIVVTSAYPGYSMISNRISDLGNTETSPAHVVFNVSMILFGCLAISGMMCVWKGLPTKHCNHCARRASIALLWLTGLGAILAGAASENVNLPVHDTGSVLIFVAGACACIVLGIAMRVKLEYGWSWPLRVFSIWTGLTMIISSIVYAIEFNASYKGVLERLIVYPLVVWIVTVAVEIAVHTCVYTEESTSCNIRKPVGQRKRPTKSRV